jgi:hypothetical protein
MRLKRTASAAATALAITTSAASAAESNRYGTQWPPAIFDVPYAGTLTIWRFPDGHSPCGESFACASTAGNPALMICVIFIPSENTFRRYGESLAATLRHELAHCNGWGKDHAGGKLIPVGTPAKWPELPATTRWLPAYPPLRCITPDRRLERCEDRQPPAPKPAERVATAPLPAAARTAERPAESVAIKKPMAKAAAREAEPAAECDDECKAKAENGWRALMHFLRWLEWMPPWLLQATEKYVTTWPAENTPPARRKIQDRVPMGNAPRAPAFEARW